MVKTAETVRQLLIRWLRHEIDGCSVDECFIAMKTLGEFTVFLDDIDNHDIPTKLNAIQEFLDQSVIELKINHLSLP